MTANASPGQYTQPGCEPGSSATQSYPWSRPHWTWRAGQQNRSSSDQPALSRALVLGPDAVPIVTDHARAEADPELALLSVMAHGRGDVDRAVQVALAAVAGARHIPDHELSVLYSDLINAALSEAARKAFPMIPQGYVVQRELLRYNVAQTKAADIVAFLKAREIALTDEQEQRIFDCLDVTLLDQWIRRAAIIASASELFE